MENIQESTTILQSRPDKTRNKSAKKKAKHPGGRPSTITPEVIAKLEQAFAIDATVKEALSYADIKNDAYYDYLKKNPEFAERIESLRQRPILKARQTIVKSLDEPKNAQWYLERKQSKEFAEVQKNEITLHALTDQQKKTLDSLFTLDVDPKSTEQSNNGNTSGT